MAKPKKKAVKAKPTPKRTTKLGTNRAAAAERRALFVEAMASNGGNKYQAAIAAGWAPGEAAKKAATRLSEDVRVLSELERRRKEVIEIAEKNTGLTVEGVLLELRGIVHSDLRQCIDAKGNLLPVKKWPDELARAICSVKVTTDRDGDRVKEIKFWDKGSGIERAMKYLGMFKVDNEQRGDAAIRALMAAVADDGEGFSVKP